MNTALDLIRKRAEELSQLTVSVEPTPAGGWRPTFSAGESLRTKQEAESMAAFIAESKATIVELCDALAKAVQGSHPIGCRGCRSTLEASRALMRPLPPRPMLLCIGRAAGAR